MDLAKDRKNILEPVNLELVNAEQLTQLLPTAKQLVQEAGQIILEVGGDGAVSEKANKSPVTEADMASHRHIVEGLRDLGGPWPVLSEESDLPATWEQRREWETFWLIDPLDGTRGFIEKRPEYTVNIALIHRHESVLGVVGVPASGTLFHACRGGKAWRAQADGEAAEIRCRAFAGDEPSVCASRAHDGGPEVRILLERLGPHRALRIDSSLKICRVAEGQADLYPRYGPTSEWDIAAAHCVVAEAGGDLVDWGLRPLRYNTGPEILNPPFLAVGDLGYDWMRLTEGLAPEPERR